MRPSRLKRVPWLGAATVAVLLISAFLAILLSRSGGQAPSQRGGSEPSVIPSPAGSPPPSADSPDLSTLVGDWEFVSRTGVPVSLLPSGAVRGPRDDIIIRADGSFRWGHWSGFVGIGGSGFRFALFPTQPAKLRRRFEEYNAGVGISTVRGKMLLVIPDLGQDRDIDLGQAAEDIDSPDMVFRRLTPSARARLESLGGAWFQTSATIAYRTADHAPGEATSPHQCLRQIAGGAIDRQTALRMCLREGAITLAWDPPGRWRMDVSSSDGTFILISTPTASYLCRHVDGGVAACAVRSSTEVENSTPFRFMLLKPGQVLDEIAVTAKAAVTQTSSRMIAGLSAECFSAAGEARQRTDRVEWCYSAGGILLFFSTATEEGGSTTLEATAVSTEVSDAEFVPPSA
jgi:hypothetical protein